MRHRIRNCLPLSDVDEVDRAVCCVKIQCQWRTASSSPRMYRQDLPLMASSSLGKTVVDLRARHHGTCLAVWPFARASNNSGVLGPWNSEHGGPESVIGRVARSFSGIACRKFRKFLRGRCFSAPPSDVVPNRLPPTTARPMIKMSGFVPCRW